MTVLFDIDSLVYSSCFGVETSDDACIKFDNQFDGIISSLDPFYDIEEVIVFGFGKNNFRKKLSPSYKANRKSELPEFFHHVKKFVLEVYDVEVANGMETDDLVAVFAEKIGYEDCIIVSIDKDYLNLPGLKYNYRTKLLSNVGEIEAMRNFYTQMIVGDSADNVNFCKGYGKKYAYKLFENVSTKFGFQRKVLYLYKEIYKNKGRERFLQCYNLLKLG